MSSVSCGVLDDVCGCLLAVRVASWKTSLKVTDAALAHPATDLSLTLESNLVFCSFLQPRKEIRTKHIRLDLSSDPLAAARRCTVVYSEWVGRTLRETRSPSLAGRRGSSENTHIVGWWRSWGGRADVLWPHLQSPSIFHKEHFFCPLELRSLSSACSFNSLYLHYKQLSLVSWQEIQEVPKTHFYILDHSFPLCILNP